LRLKNSNKKVLDLHSLKRIPGESVEQAVYRYVDKFMTPFLNQKTIDVSIVVGKGIRSSRFINGKNPLRYYVETYLTKIGCSWTCGDFMSGQEGVIRIRW
jgi:hypothetical protein